RAVRLADKIKEAFNTEPVLIKGDGGVFDVRVDGEILFSRKAQGVFPEPDEVVNKIGEILRGKK
ncbi:MAG: Rdx family protein, partial [Desulfovibrionales bacterium]|nr:Rdx family protein [Desulfovibrionales bacterium]